jgi:hypothetical protein
MTEELLRSYDIIKGGIYKHYKGETYEVIGIVINAETDERYVMYRHLSNPDVMWVRSILNFRERINLHDGTFVTRFKLVEETKES